jgi:type I site-specific restriction endonuclease
VATHADNLKGMMNLGDDVNRLAAEARARMLIDRQLTDAGWSVQDSKQAVCHSAD